MANKKFRVLIVDDQRDVRRVLGLGLKTLSQPMEVTEVPSAEEAILMGGGRSFDLIVTDVRLPGISGLELVSRLRKQNADIKIILMTGMTEHHIRREVEKANVFAHFYKPVEMADFLDAVERCLGLVETTFSPPPVELKARPTLDVPTTPQAKEEALSAAAKPAAPRPPEALTELRRKLKAKTAVLLDEAGKFVFQDGEYPELKPDSALLKAMLVSDQAQRSLSQALDRAKVDYVLFLDGVDAYVGLAPCGLKGLLAVIGPKSFSGILTAAAEALRLAGRELQPLLDAPAPAAAEAVEAALEPVVEPLFPELPPPPPDVAPDADLLAALANVEPDASMNLDDLFGPAVGDKKPASLDDFWEDVAETSGDIKLNESHLTYEQAKNMGLAPDKS